MANTVKEIKEIKVKFGNKVAENIAKADNLVNNFINEHKKAVQSRDLLMETAILAISGLDSLAGYEIKIDLDKSEATLTKV